MIQTVYLVSCSTICRQIHDRRWRSIHCPSELEKSPNDTSPTNIPMYLKNATCLIKSVNPSLIMSETLNREKQTVVHRNYTWIGWSTSIGVLFNSVPAFVSVVKAESSILEYSSHLVKQYLQRNLGTRQLNGKATVCKVGRCALVMRINESSPDLSLPRKRIETSVREEA